MDVTPDAATLSLTTLLENEDTTAAHPTVHWRILDAQGQTVATAQTDPQQVVPGGKVTFTATATLSSPALWSPETPYLYSAMVTVEASGKTHDVEQFNFGVRTVTFDPDKGLLLNGQPVKIKGTCNHQDHAGVGVALPDGLQEYRLSVLREMGSNAVRTSHNMPTPEWVAACEKRGMMMMCETRLMSSSPEGLTQLETLIKRYRNSPAVILRMTQELIANMLGVRREGVTEAAGKLQKLGVICYTRGQITVLDRKGLEERCCECYAVVRKETERLLSHSRGWQHGQCPRSLRSRHAPSFQQRASG
jgi:hypothetical protein